MHFGRVPWAAVTGLSAALFSCVSPIDSRPSSQMALWLQLAGPVRPSPARLSGFPYAPVSPPGSGATAKPRREVVELEIEIEAAVRHRPNVESQWALGVLYLLQGQVDESVGALNAAARQAPSKASLWNDLAAAYFEKARQTDQVELYAASLQAALKAHRLDPGLCEASHNVALGFRALFLRGAARRFVQLSLQHERDQGFRNELLDLQLELAQPLISEVWGRLRGVLVDEAGEASTLEGRFSQFVREWAMREELARWAKLARRGERPEAERILARLGRLGQGLKVDGGDSSVADAAELASRFTTMDPPAVIRLAEAFEAYAEGHRREEKGDLDGSRSLFEQAHAIFSDTLPGWAGWCDARLAEIEILKSRPEEARKRALGSLASLDPAAYPALAGRLEWAVGLVDLRAGRLIDSLNRFQTAARRFDRAREWLYRGAVDVLLAENLDWLGRRSEAWRLRREALRRLSHFPDSHYLHNVLGISADALAADGYGELGLEFRHEAVAAARRTGKPEILAEALQWRAETRNQSGDPDDALADLDEARQLLKDIVDPTFRRQVALDIRTARAEILRHSDPPAAFQLWSGVGETEVGAEYRQSGLTLEWIGAVLTGYRIHRSLGRIETARSLLESAIGQFERQNEGIPDSPDRLAHFRQVGALYQEMVVFEHLQGRPDSALLYADRKQQNLFGIRCAASLDKSRLEQWRRGIPEDLSVVQYAATADRLFIWLLDSRGVFPSSTREIGAQALSNLVDEAVSFWSAGSGQEGAVFRLYEDLIGPIEADLAEKSRLLVVADGRLRALPFAALRKSPSDPPLLSRLAMAKIPSLADLMNSSRAASAVEPSPAVLVGDPAFDVKGLDWLPRLPAAASEARQLAELHGAKARLLVGERATRSALLRALPEARIFHFAGHALSSPSPLLLTAPENGRSAVSAGDLHEMRFPNLQVAVLSACDTAGGRESQGVYGLAHPFLQGGAGAVVATLWRVPDEPTRRLMLDFHRRLLSGASPLKALRAAQLIDFNQNRGKPEAGFLWAAFDLVAADWSAVR